MLRVASFPITDAAGINALLDTKRLASGAHILVSEGHVCIPFEDGEPETAAQRIIAIKEQQNTLRKERDIIVHSQKVMDLLIADANDKFTAAHAAWDNNRSNKDLEAKKNEAEAGLTHATNQKISNDAEIVRIERNIAMYDEEIKSLTA